MFTPGSRGCGYKTVSGRHEWPNRDPLGEFGGFDLYEFVGNTPVDLYDPDGLLPPSNPTCQALQKKIANLEKEIADRTRELYEDPLGLPGTAPGDDTKPSLSKRGHQKILNMMKANLAAKKALYQANCGDPDPPCKQQTPSPSPVPTQSPVMVNPVTPVVTPAPAPAPVNVPVDIPVGIDDPILVP